MAFERYRHVDLPGPAAGIVDQALDELADSAAVRRLWQHDPTLWKPDGQAPAELTNRLGWLSLPDACLEPGRLADLERLAADARRRGLGHVVVCGMGGSSLVLGINRFDQPNVQDSKDNTARVLAAHGQVSVPPSLSHPVGDSEAIASFLAEAGPGDYIGLQAYLTPTAQTEQRLQAFRAALRDEFQVATTLGFAPRFLHSTGQLHKGGPPTGVFLQLVYQPREEVPIPGQSYAFGALLAAQALGDLQSLNGRGLRVRRVELGTEVVAGLEALAAAPAAFPRGVS